MFVEHWDRIDYCNFIARLYTLINSMNQTAHSRTRTEYYPPTPSILSKITHASGIRVNTTPSQLNHKSIIQRHIKSQSCYQQAHILTVSTSKQPKTQREIQTETEQQSAKYTLERPITKGAFGVVYKAHTTNLHHLAVKRVLVKQDRRNRQLVLLKSMDHPNILKMIDHYYTVDKNNHFLHIVTHLYSHSLKHVVQHKNIKSQLFPLYLYQILRGLAYLKQKDIMHRDLTPSNILVQGSTHKVVIADFGSAKINTYQANSLSYIVARAYRAPQLVFGSMHYSNEIDMWAFGCIAAELVTGRSLFYSQSTIQQMLQIVKLLGTPTQEQMCQMNPDFSLKEFESLPKIRRKALTETAISSNTLFLDMLSKIFIYTPSKRITASQAMKHPYFNCIKSKQYYEKNNLNIEQLNIQLNQHNQQIQIAPSSIKLQTSHKRMLSSIYKKSASTAAQSTLRRSGGKVFGVGGLARQLFG